MPSDDLVDKCPKNLLRVEGGRADIQQGILDVTLEMPMWTFNGTVLMCHALVVAGRLHSVVLAQWLVAFGQVLRGICRQIEKRGWHRIATMSCWRAASCA